MSTHATIAVLNSDNTISSVYLHSDGYTSFAGRMLLEHYNTQEKAEALVALGDLSRLAPSIAKPLGHDFGTPVDGYTVAYGRDRSESDVCPQKQDLQCFRIYAEGFTYLFANGRWVTMSRKGSKYLSLTLEQQTDMSDSYFVHPEAK
jgi:hypothetical protein